MADRSSRPHRWPTKTPPEVVRRIVGLRWRQRLGPVQIGGRLGMHASTVHAVPDGGAHRFLTRQQGRANGIATTRRTGERGKQYRPLIGTAFVHTVIDDHSRIAYAEICTDERDLHR